MAAYQRAQKKGLAELTRDLQKDASKAEIGKKYTIPSPINGEPLSYQIKKLSIEEAKKLKEYELNFRSGEHLTDYSVQDILPSIKQSGTNSQPIYVSKEDDHSIVIVGLRRRYCVINYGKELTVLEFDKLSEEEKAFFAKTSDIYDAPSFCDKAFKLNSFIKQKEEQGKALTTRELSNIFDLPVGTISEMKQMQHFNQGFFQLFPSLGAIRQKFIRTLISKKAYLEIDDVAIGELKNLLSQLDPSLKDSPDKLVKTYESVINGYLTNEEEPVINEVFKPGKYKNAATVKSTKKGQVVSFSISNIEEDDLHLISDILDKYKN